MAKREAEIYDFKAFGQAVKDARIVRGESRKNVSDDMNISPRHLANIKNYFCSNLFAHSNFTDKISKTFCNSGFIVYVGFRHFLHGMYRTANNKMKHNFILYAHITILFIEI